MVQILLTPDAGGGHGMDQIRAAEKRNTNRLPGSVSSLDAATNGVNFMVEVVQDERSRLLILLCRFPRIHHQPVGSLVHCQLTHCDTVDKIISILRSTENGEGRNPYRWSALANPACDRHPTPETDSLPRSSYSVLNLT